MWAAVAFAVLGIIGQAVTYHYLTDTVGSVLLGTSLVCLAVATLRAGRRVRRLRLWPQLGSSFIVIDVHPVQPGPNLPPVQPDVIQLPSQATSMLCTMAINS